MSIELTSCNSNSICCVLYRPRKNNSIRGRVQCFTCGSLFNTDAPDCFAFNVNDKAQMKTCDAGEACLWYSYQKSDSETAVIRECFSKGILLGRSVMLPR